MITKEQAIYILSCYKNSNKRCELMIEKITIMQTNIYSAQAGFVENETGCRVSGGSHVAREQKIAELVDLKDQYARRYTEHENICSNIMKLIENIYTNKIVSEEEITKESNKLLKLQRYESVLIEYYVDGNTIKAIASKNGYTERQTIRTLNAARDYFYQLNREKKYEELMEYLKTAPRTQMMNGGATC